MSAKSVFISHATKDDAQVRDLRHALELLEVLVWTDSENLTPGAILTTEIERNIETADAFIVLLTPSGFASSWVRREIRHAQKSGKEIISLLGRGVERVTLEDLFPAKPVTITLKDGPAAIQDALPEIRTALKQILPTGHTAAPASSPAPVADLVLELNNPVIAENRATATARLVYCPADGGGRVEGDQFTFTAPLGPIEAEELAWYLERYINWPSGYFEDRANRVVGARRKSES